MRCQDLVSRRASGTTEQIGQVYWRKEPSRFFIRGYVTRDWIRIRHPETESHTMATAHSSNLFTIMTSTARGWRLRPAFMNRSVGSLTTLGESTQLSSDMVFSDASHPQACLWSSCSAARVPRRRDRWSCHRTPRPAQNTKVIRRQLYLYKISAP